MRRDDGRDARGQEQGAVRLVGVVGQAGQGVDESGQYGEVAHVDDDLAGAILVRFNGGHASLRNYDILVTPIAAAEAVVEARRVNDERALRFVDARQLAAHAFDRLLAL